MLTTCLENLSNQTSGGSPELPITWPVNSDHMSLDLAMNNGMCGGPTCITQYYPMHNTYMYAVSQKSAHAPYNPAKEEGGRSFKSAHICLQQPITLEFTEVLNKH